MCGILSSPRDGGYIFGYDKNVSRRRSVYIFVFFPLEIVSEYLTEF
jgi:hypothetical protein